MLVYLNGQIQKIQIMTDLTSPLIRFIQKNTPGAAFCSRYRPEVDWF